MSRDIDGAFTTLAKALEAYDPDCTIPYVAGLLTVPTLQHATLRLELLTHLAVLHCRGTRTPGGDEASTWLDHHLRNTPAASFEDPPEDVFLSNVRTPTGNRRVFEGLNESTDHFVQQMVEVLFHSGCPIALRRPLLAIDALLKLSDSVAEQLNLPRWCHETQPPGALTIPSPQGCTRHAAAVTFTNDRLRLIDVDPSLLQPFVLPDEDRTHLESEDPFRSSLERRPLINLADRLVLVRPTAVGAALRAFVLEELDRSGHLQVFANLLASQQTGLVDTVLKEALADASEPSRLSATHPGTDRPPLSQWSVVYDADKFVHVALLHDLPLGRAIRTGMDRFAAKAVDAIQDYVVQIIDEASGLAKTSTGFFLLVVGGLGGPWALPYPKAPTDWIVSAIALADFVMLSREQDDAIVRYLKCLAQKHDAETRGIQFQAFSDYDFYCLWRESDCRAIPLSVALNDNWLVAIPTDSALPVRTDTRRRIDEHMSPMNDGKFAFVQRLNTHSHFRYLEARPIYVSVDDVRMGLLRGVVETKHGARWLTVDGDKRTRDSRELLYRLWSGLMDAFYEIVEAIESRCPPISNSPIEVRFDCNNMTVTLEPGRVVAREYNVMPQLTVNEGARHVTVAFPEDFLEAFRTPSNTGERLMVQCMVQGFMVLCKGDADQEVVETVTREVVRKGMRILHLFAIHPFEHILSSAGGEVRAFTREDLGFVSPALADGCYTAGSEGTLTTKAACGEFLHGLVDKLLGQLVADLKRFDRESVILQLYRRHDSVAGERHQWRVASRALGAIHGEESDVSAVARAREAERSGVAIVARGLLEMAICECPAVGGREPSGWDVDRLLARGRLLIAAATDSDAIYHGLTEGKIRIHANGEYDVDQRFRKNLIERYAAGYFDEKFREDVEGYEGHYAGMTMPATDGSGPFDKAFVRAFRSEFDLSPDNVLEGFAGLMDLVVDRGELVVRAQMGELAGGLIRRRGFGDDVCRAFLRTVTIFHRDPWERPPRGFRQRDLYPWRFRRPLSLLARPLLAFGASKSDIVVFGAATLRAGLSYLLERGRRGWLPQSCFRSREMVAYVGTVNERRGREFTLRTARRLRELGWSTRTEVGMAEFGASAEYGDVDVVAWKVSGEVQLLECKCLYLARTVAEICGRFRGEAADELAKHMRRMEWMENHVKEIARVVGFVPRWELVVHRLVTNTHVPMRYIEGLPMQSELIGLPEWLEMDGSA